MYTNRLKIVFALLLLGCVIGFGPGIVMAQEIETPVETPIETPTETPVIVPTATPIPVLPTPTPTTAAETPVETPTETPVEVPTNTPVPVEPTPTESAVVEPTPTESSVPVPTPTESSVPIPTPTESSVPTPTPVPENIELILSAPGEVNTGDSVNVSIEIKNAVNVDAFGFDILQSNAILDSAVVQTDGTLTSDFAFVLGNTLGNPAGAVRIAAAGGASSVNGDGMLLNIQYTAQSAGEVSLSLGNILDDLIGADVMTTVIVVNETSVVEPTPTETGVVEPTPTETGVVEPTPTETGVVEPTPTPTLVPEPTATPTETGVVEPTPTETGVVQPTPTPTKVPEPTATPVVPTATPTAIEVNPKLGIVSLDELGGTYPRGNAVHNFDIGTSNKIGQLIKPGELDGQIDPDALGPFLFIKGQPFPIAKDLEFTGEIKANGNGSEGVYFLMGGSISNVPPVNGRLGATGGPNNGGIDINNDGQTINFGLFKSDIVPVLFMATEKNPNGEFLTSLVDIEPAGNDGFYVLTKKGKIYAEGAALEALDTVNTITPGSKAVGLKIWRGKDIDVSNSQYSSDLIGTGAYILDSAGAIHVVGDAPALQTENLPVIPMFAGSGVMKDIEFIPNADGTEWIGLGVLMGDGMIAFAPFADQPAGTPEHLQGLLPFGNLPEGFPINIARDFEVEISESTIYGLDENGATVAKTGRRIGIFMFDGFGGVHVGGASTRYAPALIPTGLDYDGSYVIDGKDTIAYPVNPPYTFNVDVNKDVELAWPVKR